MAIFASSMLALSRGVYCAKAVVRVESFVVGSRVCVVCSVVCQSSFSGYILLALLFGKQGGGGKQERKVRWRRAFMESAVAGRGGKLTGMSVNVSRKGHVPQAKRRITSLRSIVYIYLRPAKPEWSRDHAGHRVRTRSVSASIDALHTSLIEALSVKMSKKPAQHIQAASHHNLQSKRPQ